MTGKLVLFGAGKIGRSFIGQLFARSGYEVVFVDINPAVINALNEKGKYKVVIKSEKEETIWVENVRGILASEKQLIIDELVTADIAAVSVGQKGLPHILPVIANALEKRFQEKKAPLDIILAENMRNADAYMFHELQKLISPSIPLKNIVGLIETSIGKMVPIMPREEEEKDVLQVFAEPYNSLILDKKGFKNTIPKVEGLTPKDNMKAWVDRKSFIHNFGHAAVAYTGYLYNPGFKYLYEALAVKSIKDFTRLSMIEASEILMKKYPGEFTVEHLTDHIDDLIQRFENKALGDTIFRVGCDLKRKLSSNDRIAGLLIEGLELRMPVDNILFTLICGFCFKATDEKGVMLSSDIEFHNDLSQKGPEYMLKNLCGIPASNPEILSKALNFHKNIKNLFEEKIK
jgi:mannitol-1-phosphate 5-dehydrogenase